MVISRAVVAFAFALAPAAHAAAQSPAAPQPPRDLRAIAERESAREQEKLRAAVDAILVDLRKSTNETLPHVAGGIAKLAALGRPALPALIASLEQDTATPEETNAATNAGRAIAAIDAAARASGALPGATDVHGELRRLAASENPYARRNALHVAGLLGDPALADAAVPRLADPDASVRREAIVALGKMGGDDVVTHLAPFVQAEDPALAAAAIEALASRSDPATAARVLERLTQELAAPAPAPSLLYAAVRHLTVAPLAEAVPVLEQPLLSRNVPSPLQADVVTALSAIAAADPTARDAVAATLHAALGSDANSVVKAAAHALVALGDESGIAAVTREMDMVLEKAPGNYGVRYRRAEVFLEFGRWKDALRDFRDGAKAEKDLREPDRVNFGLARAYAGLGRAADAFRHLRQLQREDFADLPASYPEFREMARDTRYERYFTDKDA